MNPRDKKIVLIEGKQTNHPSFFLSLQKKGYNVEITSTGNGALEKIREEVPIVVLIDVASLRTAGNRIVYRIKKAYPKLPVIIITDAFSGTKKTTDADLVMVMPFTIQKLLNRVNLFMPAHEDSLREIGSIRLDMKNNRVFVQNRPASVTPRVAQLLDLLMDQPGEVFAREDLFRKIWETDYIQDMRSLDVHIRWLREAVETDPKNPQIIQTVRGIGYRFVPSGNHVTVSSPHLDNDSQDSIIMEDYQPDKDE